MLCDFVQIATRDGVRLEGLVFLPKGADTVAVWIHGLTSNGFRNYERNTILARAFNEAGMAFATFNTRGHDVVAYSVRRDKRKKKGYRSMTIGSAYEKFEDSFLDLEAIVDYLKKDFSKIFLLGHSTGANKAAYYLAREHQKVTGGALISPVSDVPMFKEEMRDNYQEVVRVAKKMVGDGHGQDLIPSDLSKNIYTAKRFLSLATQESVEQLFPNREFRGPLKIFSRIKTSLLVLFGEKDDYLEKDRVLAQDLIGAFRKYNRSKKLEAKTISGSDHGFSEHERELGKILIDWIRNL